MPAENRKNEAGYIGSADKVPGKETLHTAIDGFRLGLSGKGVFERGEIDDLVGKQRGRQSILALCRKGVALRCRKTRWDLAWCASSQNLHFAMFFSGFCFFVVYEAIQL